MISFGVSFGRDLNRTENYRLRVKVVDLWMSKKPRIKYLGEIEYLTHDLARDRKKREPKDSKDYQKRKRRTRMAKNTKETYRQIIGAQF